MKSIFIIVALFIGFTCNAQSSEKHITFEGVSLGESRDVFIFQLNDSLGWKFILDDDDVSGIDSFRGELYECSCSATIVYTPISKKPANVSISVRCHHSLVNVNFTDIAKRLTQHYGNPFVAKKLYDDIYIWKIEGVGTVILSMGFSDIIKIDITDELNRNSYHREYKIIDNKVY